MLTTESKGAVRKSDFNPIPGIFFNLKKIKTIINLFVCWIVDVSFRFRVNWIFNGVVCLN